MNRNFFFKKRLMESLFALGFWLRKVFVRLYKIIFAKRTILFVTNEKIRTVNLGPVVQMAFFIAIAYIANLALQSLNHNSIIESKDSEIERLNAINEHFEDEFEAMNEKLEKVNEYLISVTGKVHKVSEIKEEDKTPKKFDKHSMSRQDKKVFALINHSSYQIATLKAATQGRIEKIEKAINITGLNFKSLPQKKVLSKIESEYQKITANKSSDKNLGKGGPIEEDAKLEADLAKKNLYEKKVENLENLAFKSEIDYLMVLEKLTVMMPLSRPMKNYQLSSPFGVRHDPITGRGAMHKGLDFVGVSNAKIISPSRGRVVLAGRYSQYGNAVVIDHGFGITSRYGHLSKVKVKPGDIVNKGDVIALQGSTGRSTGQHLHYEVRYRDIPLNPRKFIEAGETLFNGNKKYADS